MTQPAFRCRTGNRAGRRRSRSPPEQLKSPQALRRRRWQQPELTVQIPHHDAAIELDGRGLLLVPSAFAATRPFVSDRPPWLPALIYPARGIATLWQQADTAPAAVARLIGRTRAAILADLAGPRSTTELSDRLSLSPAAASHHLTTLREAGLLSTRREGRSVLYVRTTLGDTLAASGGG